MVHIHTKLFFTCSCPLLGMNSIVFTVMNINLTAIILMKETLKWINNTNHNCLQRSKITAQVSERFLDLKACPDTICTHFLYKFSNDVNRRFYSLDEHDKEELISPN